MFIPKILTPEECKQLVNEFDSATNKNAENEIFYRGSVGLYQPPSSLALVPRLEQQIVPTFGKLKFENSYLRSYVKGSILGIHTDRPGLDVTLSVCLEHNFEGAYPLWCSQESFLDRWDVTIIDHSKWKSKATPFELELGDGAVMEGIKYPHWRDTFDQDARAVYIFFHWRYDK